MHQCDAVVTYQATDWGFEPIRCGQVVGVRSYQSSLGEQIAYCSMEGHRESVERRFGKDETEHLCVECGGPVVRRNALRCRACWDNGRPTTPLDVRFWAKVDRRGPDECWPWTGSTSRGYGYISPGGPRHMIVPAHRVAWELANDASIPDGLWVLHRCDNPVCVNPAHLWLGTVADNNRDMFAKGRGWQQVHPERMVRGERHHNSVLTDIEVREIRDRYESGETNQSALGREFGVSHSTIQRIVRGTSRLATEYPEDEPRPIEEVMAYHEPVR